MLNHNFKALRCTHENIAKTMFQYLSKPHTLNKNPNCPKCTRMILAINSKISTLKDSVEFWHI